ncbi:MAG: hypothetical protein H7A25_21195 [Leptospiraceae bacterium]|nr:hypothetical protein [Leptospiraceae bacterium]MCP5502427.1 hypothetical protein [Leptospiraceae bacterium]
MIPYQAEPFIDSILSQNGLNLQHVFELKDLPEDILKPIVSIVDEEHQYKQVIVFAHGGRNRGEE